MTRVILIRHGHTDYSSKGICCGITDPPLNEKGLAQCQELSSKLGSIKIDKVYSSNLRRAIQSAKAIFKNSKIIIVPEFQEIDFGIFDGLKYNEIMNYHPEVYSKWLKDPKNTTIPQGGNLSDLHKKVKAKLLQLVSKNKNKTIAIVTHGGPIKTILCDALGYGLERFWDIKPEMVDWASINIVDYKV